MRTASLALLFLALASLAVCHDSFAVVGASDPTINGYIASINRQARLTLDADRKSVSVAGYCNRCFVSLDSFSAGCTKMACQNPNMQMDAYLLQVLTEHLKTHGTSDLTGAANGDVVLRGAASQLTVSRLPSN